MLFEVNEFGAVEVSCVVGEQDKQSQPQFQI